MTGKIRGILARLAAASAVAFVGAVPMAGISGFYPAHNSRPEDSMAVLTAGVILFALTCAFGGTLARAAADRLADFGRVETRPGPGIALALILCGTLCVLSSLWGAWSSRAIPIAAGTADAIRQMQASIQDLQARGLSNFNFSIPTPPTPDSSGPMILTSLAFLLGSVLVALGVWSSFGPHSPAEHGLFTNGFAQKHPITAADETRI